MTDRRPRVMNVLDLFSGIGGFSLGLERAGMTTIAFCEIEEYPRNILKKHWPDVPIFEDVRKLKGSDIDEPVDVICGGFPCQNISTGGKGEGIHGDRSSLWFDFARLIEEVGPSWVIIENSPNLRNTGLCVVLENLLSFGFDAEWHVIPASAVGAPHQRERLWIIAYSKRLGFQGSWELEPSVHSTPGEFREADRLIHAFRERSLPFVCGGHDGVPSRVDRDAVKALGNAVVPQIPEIIGRAIMEAGLTDYL